MRSDFSTTPAKPAAGSFRIGSPSNDSLILSSRFDDDAPDDERAERDDANSPTALSSSRWCPAAYSPSAAE